MEIVQPYINAEPLSNEWFAARKVDGNGKFRITASDFHRAVSKGVKTREALLRKKLKCQTEKEKRQEDFLQNMFAWGREHEQAGIDAFLKDYPQGYFTQTGLWLHPDNQRIGGTPDGILYTTQGELFVLEVKCPCTPAMLHNLPPAARSYNALQCMANAYIVRRALRFSKVTAVLLYWTPDGHKAYEYSNREVEATGGPSLTARLEDFLAWADSEAETFCEKWQVPLLSGECPRGMDLS